MNSEQKLILIGFVIFLVAAASTFFILFYFRLLPIDTNTSDDAPTLLRQELNRDIKEYKMIRRVHFKDLVLEKENFTQTLDYQKYVTPDDQTVRSYIYSNTITNAQQAYLTALNWAWVSDSTLHGVLEKWLLPSEFIKDTPVDPDNPIQGVMVSDCESQAYTLASILEALGTSKQNVRVVIGLVDFEGQTGGHAWVQIYENGNWFELEPTSGPYWDDEELRLVQTTGFSYNYFKTHTYPAEEYWAFFNDVYYYNPETDKKSADLPSFWITT